MNLATLAKRSLLYHARSHVGAILGSAVAAAVLIGALVVGDSVRESLKRMALARLGPVPASRGDYRYAPGKWTLKEVIGHLADTERVFAYRALSIARGDPSPLPSFDDQAWVAEMGAGDRTLADTVEEFALVRRASIALFRHLPPAAWLRRGMASEHPASVRALAYVMAGHATHHLEVVGARYLG